MSDVVLENGRLDVRGETIDLLSGEFHFWRSSPGDWRRALAALEEMGLPIVATYVSWQFHELEPGRFDFDGRTDPSRNLLGFLRLCDSLGFRVFLRPGPYIYAEWRNLGVPDRAASLPRYSLAFLDEALPYMRAVCDAARPFFAGNGGPIVLWQADNEIDVMPWAYERDLGAGNEPGEFQEWLKQRYGKIAALNERWGTALKSFESARPIQRNLLDDRDFRPRHLDWIRFRQEVNTRHSRWMIETYRKLGVDLPLVLNSYPVQDSLNWRELTETSDLFGIDPYPSSGFRAEPEEHRVFVEKCLVQSTLGSTPYLAELESGVWVGHHEYTGEPCAGHYRLLCLSALAAGIQGWNWYMVVERDRWLYSPIDNRGRKRRPLFEEFQGLAKLFGEVKPAGLRRLVHTAAFHDSLQAASPGAFRDDPARRSLYAAGVPYSLWDPADERNFARGKKPLLYYSGHRWLSRESHARLRRFVEEGGRLALPGIWPRFDEDLEPFEQLGIPLPDLCFDGSSLVIDRRGEAIPLTGAVFAYGGVDPPGRPIRARVVESEEDETVARHRGPMVGERYTVGFEQKLGKGRILWLGFTPTPAATRWIHGRMRAPVAARALSPDTQACLLERKGEAVYLVVLNLADRAQTARVALNRAVEPPAAREWLHGAAVEVLSRNGEAEVAIPLPPKDGAFLSLGAVRSE